MGSVDGGEVAARAVEAEGIGEPVQRPGDPGPALRRASVAGRPAVVRVIVDTAAHGSPPGTVELAGVYAAENA